MGVASREEGLVFAITETGFAVAADGAGMRVASGEEGFSASALVGFWRATGS